MKEKIPLKYACLDSFDKLYNSCTNNEIKDLLFQLRELIFYQMNEIKNQRIDIVGIKHEQAWKHYDNK
jgi:hypothetical protein